MTLNYFAYGSNLHPLRLRERVPSARLIAPVELTGYRLKFHKRGRDDSGKCNLFPSGAACDRVHGALYELAVAHKPVLDRYEGVGNGYRHHSLRLSCLGGSGVCYTYLAQAGHIDEGLRPYQWYKELVVLGAEHLGLPLEYIAGLNQVPAVEDPDHRRRQQHEVLIGRLVAANHAISRWSSAPD